MIPGGSLSHCTVFGAESRVEGARVLTVVDCGGGAEVSTGVDSTAVGAEVLP